MAAGQKTGEGDNNVRRLLLLAMTSGLLAPGAPAHAGESIPEDFLYVGGHFSRYQVASDAYGDDFIEDASLPGLQAGYRFPGDISTQVWWERNNTRFEESGRKVDLNIIMASLRLHTPRLVLGVEPYAGLGAGEITYDTARDENDESFISLELGFQNRIRPHWLLDLGVRAPYSTDEERWDSEFYIGLNHIFGVEGGTGDQSRERDTPMVTPQPTLRDGDRDGVPDTVDECPATPAGSRVANTGCLAAPATP